MSDDPKPGWYDNTDGQRQWWDGKAWGPIAEKSDPVSAPSDQKPPSSVAKGCGIGCLVILVIGALVGLASWFAASTPEAQAERDQELSIVLAERACERAVRAQLKSPTTAEFSGTRGAGSGSSYTVTGSVDAENGFGAMIRNSFTCEVNVVDESASVKSALVG